MFKPKMSKPLQQLTLALLVAGVLSGCSLAPQYLRPDAPVAAGYDIASSGAGTAATATSGRPATEIGWREFFRDARLQALIASALDNNRDLRTAALRIEEARAQYNIQSADRLPNRENHSTPSRMTARLSPPAVRCCATSRTGGRSDAGPCLPTWCAT